MTSVEREQTNKHTNTHTHTHTQTYIQSKNWGNLFLRPNFLFSIFLALFVWKYKKTVSNKYVTYHKINIVSQMGFFGHIHPSRFLFPNIPNILLSYIHFHTFYLHSLLLIIKFLSSFLNMTYIYFKSKHNNLSWILNASHLHLQIDGHIIT